MAGATFVDPILALLEFLEEYRRSWRCWLLGGPAALEGASVGGVRCTAAVRLHAHFEYEIRDRVPRNVLATLAREDMWYDAPQPRPPAPGEFRNAVQTFPLAHTRAYDWCTQCWGTGRRRCPTCKGQGKKTCLSCGGAGCARCAEGQSEDLCPDCSGSGTVRCRCAEQPDIPVLLHYEAARYIYRHAQSLWDVLPEGAEGNCVARLLASALAVAGSDLAAVGEDAVALMRNALLDQLPDPDLRERLWHVAAHIQDQAVLEAPGRLLFQRLEARVAPTAFATVYLGRRWCQFWTVGTSDGCKGLLRIAPCEESRGLWLWLAQMLFCGWFTAWHFLQTTPPGQPWIGYLWMTLLGAILLERLNPRSVRRWARRLSNRLQHLRESLRGAPSGNLVVVLGPDPRRSSLLYALFTHLAAFAQLANPVQGGTVLDDCHPDLTALLAESDTAPKWSHTCRLEFGSGVGSLRRARLVHMVCTPAEQIGEVHRQQIRRAHQVWLVVPSDAVEEDLGVVASLLESAQADTPLTVAIDGPWLGQETWGNSVLAQALAGRFYRMWRVDLSDLRDRYLSGSVRAEEAMAIVRWMVGDTEEVPTASLEMALPASTEASRMKGASRASAW